MPAVDLISDSTYPSTAHTLRSTVTEAGVVEVSLDATDLGMLEPDDVVVRVEAAPVNPSDLGWVFAGADLGAATTGGPTEPPVLRAPLSEAGLAAVRRRVGQALPLGNEGSGTVVAAGSSPEAQALLGAVVSTLSGGMYCDFRRTRAAMCLALPEGLTAEQGAASWVNPLTAIGIVETAREGGHTALIHTAAASTVGQMVFHLCRDSQLPLINIVRSARQVQLLRDLGATWVCNTSSDTFDDDLLRAIRETGATVAFDAVGGGTLAVRLLAAMDHVLTDAQPYSRYGSATLKQVYQYGHLDTGPTVLDRDIGMAWSISGWVLNDYMTRTGPERLGVLARRVSQGLTTTFASTFSHHIGLTDLLDPDVVVDIARLATGAKYLMTPQR